MQWVVRRREHWATHFTPNLIRLAAKIPLPDNFQVWTSTYGSYDACLSATAQLLGADRIRMFRLPPACSGQSLTCIMKGQMKLLILTLKSCHPDLRKAESKLKLRDTVHESTRLCRPHRWTQRRPVCSDCKLQPSSSHLGPWTRRLLLTRNSARAFQWPAVRSIAYILHCTATPAQQSDKGKILPGCDVFHMAPIYELTRCIDMGSLSSGCNVNSAPWVSFTEQQLSLPIRVVESVHGKEKPYFRGCRVHVGSNGTTWGNMDGTRNELVHVLHRSAVRCVNTKKCLKYAGAASQLFDLKHRWDLVNRGFHRLYSGLWRRSAQIK